ncbi:hypothetical protein O0I10_007496 [Lichtheimia ornata]|uniref:BZIP domain-containing protein n=1 Tax=Lichtheimia ornata TaxID=688661 RepID=A0AAD7XTX3_9FUNG|nr:uncharacterized protein O0I10_007496 [Lichtheimia ornata]KAJ8656899.1 hypothetical protein O0I10_007496 [Lichtheimia ornata]
MNPNVDPFFLQQQDLPWELDSSQQQYSQPTMTPSSYPQQPMPLMQQLHHHQPHSPAAAFSMASPASSSMSIHEGLPQHIVPIPFQQQQQQQQQQQPHPGLLTVNPPGTLPQQASTMMAGAPGTMDINGQPVKIRKKPGRKPNPASPAVRKAQNRAAQRAFRERKERHLRDLENTIRSLREQRNHATKELNSMKTKLDGYKAENWYLKGVVLTLQFVCLHHSIQIPTHSPYLTEEALNDMAKTSPHAIEAYVNAYTRNNIDLKPMMASQFANMAKTEEENEGSTTNNNNPDPSSTQPLSPQPPPSEAGSSIAPDSSMTGTFSMLHDDGASTSHASTTHDIQFDMDTISEPAAETTIKTEPSDPTTAPSSLSAIQQIRLQLRVQSTLSRLGKSSVRLQPTLLQLAIPHDPRIDLIPTPHMRDRMIIFRDLMDYDRCFSMLLNGAVYHGGDPTMSESWELPGDFFAEFWYLATNYDYNKTNKWRRLKGLPEVDLEPKDMLQGTKDSPIEQYLWTDDLSEPMPSLQPMGAGPQDSRQRSTSPPQQQQHSLSSPSHPLYESLRSPPELRNPIHSASLDAMMDLMSNLSTSH